MHATTKRCNWMFIAFVTEYFTSIFTVDYLRKQNIYSGPDIKIINGQTNL
jgi:hypothetical protein